MTGMVSHHAQRRRALKLRSLRDDPVATAEAIVAFYEKKLSDPTLDPVTRELFEFRLEEATEKYGAQFPDD